jgi:signal transduction histidine kinase
MTEDQLAHITEPFYRTDRSRSRGEGGTGLGLSLCARIAKAHHATLKFQSVPEKGTTVFVTFTTL